MTDIFISYSHKDEAWKDELQKHLRVLQLSSDFAVWDDRQIELGENWLPAIERAIANARVAILLVSSDFLSSSFVVQEEIPKFLQRREQDGLKVVPVIVRPCTWQVVPWLADLQGATKDNRALSRFSLGSHQLEKELSQVVLKVYGLLVESRAEEQRKLAAKREAERLAAEKRRREAEAEKLRQEQAERERLVAIQKAEDDRLQAIAAEKARQEQQERDVQEAKRKAKESAERAAADQAKQARLAQEKAEREARKYVEAEEKRRKAEEDRQRKAAEKLAKPSLLKATMSKKRLLSVGGAGVLVVAIAAYSYSIGIGGRVPATADYQIHDDGTVTDTITGLMWKQCAEGHEGKDCSGTATDYTWDDAMAKLGSKVGFAGYSDWRMPTREELRTLVWCSNGVSQEVAWEDKDCVDRFGISGGYQRPAINMQAFPNTPSSWFWSSSPYASNSGYTWVVNFGNGNDYTYGKDNTGAVRLVRSGQ